MQEIRCKKCGSNNHVKSGYVRDNHVINVKIAVVILRWAIIAGK